MCAHVQPGRLEAACWLCDDGLMASERERVREKTNMIPVECCNAACWDTHLATMFCWGCAAAQMKRELQVCGSGTLVRARPSTPVRLRRSAGSCGEEEPRVPDSLPPPLKSRAVFRFSSVSCVLTVYGM